MKVAIVTDTHFGARSESKAVLDHQLKFWDQVFFPFLEREPVDYVFHLGDLVDRRKYVNFSVLQKMKERFLDQLVWSGAETIFIPGNHDSYYKNTLDVNAVDLLVKNSDHFTIINEPRVQEWTDGSGLSITFLPWICPENYDKSMAAIASAPEGSFCAAHLELKGFEMYRGRVAEHGMSSDVFKKYHSIFTGHYHRKSSKGNIHYLGAPYEMIWSDYDDSRGFHVWDTREKTIEFIENPFKLHAKVIYRDGESLEATLASCDFSELEGKIVKVVVDSRSNQFWFEKFYSALDSAKPASVQVVEDHKKMNEIDAGALITEGKEYVEILNEAVDEMGSEDAQALKELMHQLWVEAQSAAV